MDYGKLVEILPKVSKNWSTDEIFIWLSFIGLSKLYEKFSIITNYLGDFGVVGETLHTLSEKDLK